MEQTSGIGGGQDAVPLEEAEALFANWVGDLLQGAGVTSDWLPWVQLLVLTAVLVLVCSIAWWITRKILLNIVSRIAVRTSATWDDHLVNRKVFKGIANIVPTVLLHAAIPVLFRDFEAVEPVIEGIVNAVIVIICIAVVIRLLNAITDMLLERPALADKPIGSYVQLGKITTYIIGGVLIFSVLFHKSPLYFFSAMGAMTAVLLLVFKDTILGFVASIQIAANDMVRLGDWVSMPKYGADGDVVEINLTTVKVSNFDKTITTIPTYSFIGDSFKNWRAMSESGGRRIKRAIYLRTSSVKFVSPEMLDRFRKIASLEQYLIQREQEINDWNAKRAVNETHRLNGRSLTNIGIFRVYAEQYLRSNPHLNLDMTCMVRQMEAGEKGVPLEIYCFSANQDWVPYEAIIADIFDHLMAAVREFDLEIFEDWSGN
ncbi:MAG: mechanosensitive ion channel domain-containing protein [Chloroflexota bacterium]